MKKDVVMEVAAEIVLGFILIAFNIFVLCGAILLLMDSDLLWHYLHGALIVIFGFIYLSALIIPFALRKKFKKMWKSILTALVTTIVSVCLCALVLMGVSSHVSHFDVGRWNEYPDLRLYMIDELEPRVMNMTERQVKDLLGDPCDVSTQGARTVYDYYAGHQTIDDILIRISFEDGAAVFVTWVAT